MFYVSKQISPQVFSVTDTEDNVTERCSLADLNRYFKLGLEVKGVVGGEKGVISVSVYDLNFEKSFAMNKIFKGNIFGNDNFTIRQNGLDVELCGFSDEYVGRLFAKCSIVDLIIPEGVTKISNQAWYYLGEQLKVLSKLKKGSQTIGTLVLPDSIKKLEAYTFSGCKVNTLITSKYLKEIEGMTFTSETTISSIVVNSNCKLHEKSFDGVISLESAKLCSSIIPTRCFHNCYSLNNVELSMVEEIQDSSFARCSSLRTIICSRFLKKLEVPLSREVLMHYKLMVFIPEGIIHRLIVYSYNDIVYFIPEQLVQDERIGWNYSDDIDNSAVHIFYNSSNISSLWRNELSSLPRLVGMTYRKPKRL